LTEPEEQRRPRIVCAGMCNTKSVEMRFLAEQVAEHGGEPIVMDLSLGAAVDWADVSLQEVLAATGARVEDVFAAPRADAIEMVGGAGARKIVEMRAAGRCDGIISWAGSVGTTAATQVMRALPLGVPKVMLTDQASADVSMWLGGSDIFISNPIGEQGINAITRKAIGNAAAAIVAMAREPEVEPGSKPLAAVTGYGSTTPTVLRCVAFLEKRGFEVAVFHAVGPGAAMEDLVRSGLITAVIDLTTAELMNDHFGSVYGTPKTWRGRRLTAAAEMGIPQVVVPGGMDQAALGPLHTVPQRYLDEMRAGLRPSFQGSGSPYMHNESVTIMLVNPDEQRPVYAEMAERLKGSRGPTQILIPMRGWSAYDQPAEAATLERGWAKGNGDAPTWQPDPDRPSWSSRSSLLLSILREQLDGTNPNVDLLAVDMHILDSPFVDLVERAMGDMLDGKWRKGLYREVAAAFA
jgi:uncharacterized protein (UPF0261 family)